VPGIGHTFDDRVSLEAMNGRRSLNQARRGHKLDFPRQTAAVHFEKTVGLIVRRAQNLMDEIQIHN